MSLVGKLTTTWEIENTYMYLFIHQTVVTL